MKTTENAYTSPEKHFTVTEKDTNAKKTLLINVLYQEMENFVVDIISKHFYFAYPVPLLYKLQLLENAYLNDQLLLKSKIIKFNDAELQLLISVKNHNHLEEDAAICTAVFKFKLLSAISKAS